MSVYMSVCQFRECAVLHLSGQNRLISRYGERSQNCGFLGNQNDGERPAGAGGAGDGGGVPRQPPGFRSSLSTELEGVV